MDDVPFVFCESVCATLGLVGVWYAKDLSGDYGRLARLAVRHEYRYVAVIKDGVVQEKHLHSRYTNVEVQVSDEVEAVPKKVRRVSFHLYDTKRESVAECIRIARLFPYASYRFDLFSSSISEAWADFASSLRRLDCVEITEKLDSDALRLFQKLVTGRKLCTLIMFAGACEGGNIEMLKTLLCQDQFKKLRICNSFAGPWKNWDGDAVGELLQFWSENSEKLRGKILLLDRNCKGSAKQLEQFVLRRASHTATEDLGKVLKVCSKEECDFVNREYQHNHWMFAKPSCIYKYEDARKRSARHRIYVSFECPTGYDGCDDLTVMQHTTCLQILFS
uniref:TIR domain-containing protein n=1 Tax=Steinernema glaseri TaxID=37863 RepID=A0A1I7ZWK5_9BILA